MHHALLHIVNANNNLRCGAFKNRNQKATHGIGRYMVDCKLFCERKKEYLVICAMFHRKIKRHGNDFSLQLLPQGPHYYAWWLIECVMNSISIVSERKVFKCKLCSSFLSFFHLAKFCRLTMEVLLNDL